MTTVRFGILGAARIATQKMIPAMRKMPQVCQVVALASRDGEKGRSIAEGLSIPVVFDQYEELLQSPDIDAVYIPLPNHLHLPWAVKALQAGKHVLCEKPVALTVEQGRALTAEAARHPKLKIMEAFMYRHHEQWRRTKDYVESGAIGEVRAIQSLFSYFTADPENIRNKPEFGGGAMLDIGCYSLSLARWLFAAKPDAVCGMLDRDPVFGTDRLFSGLMRFGTRTASFTCSTQLERFQRVTILGTTGWVELFTPFNAPQEGATRMTLCSDGQKKEMDVVCDQYAEQVRGFCQAVLKDEPVPVSLEDAVENLQVHEALCQSARQQRWVSL